MEGRKTASWCGETRTAKTGPAHAAKARAADAAKVWATHTAEMRPATHPTKMHAASEATHMHAATHAAAAMEGERWGHKGECRADRSCNQATAKLAAHH
jgi:hypothetical protein